METNQTTQTRCKICDHLTSFHSEDGCGTWLLGVRAVPLYRCACVCTGPAVPNQGTNEPTGEALQNIRQEAPNAPQTAREKLNQVAEELRKTAEDLRSLENLLDKALQRLKQNPPQA